MPFEGYVWEIKCIQKNYHFYLRMLVGGVIANVFLLI